MIHYTYLAIILLFFNGCCKDKITDWHVLTNTEKELIPYTAYQTIRFIDENGVTIIAESQPQIIEHVVEYNHPERCDQSEIETLTSSINFASKSLKIDIRLKSGPILNLRFRGNSSKAYPFYSYCDPHRFTATDNELQDISLYGFEFENIHIYEICTEEDPLKKIIYSDTNGIEFIELKDEKWLKLNL